MSKAQPIDLTSDLAFLDEHLADFTAPPVDGATLSPRVRNVLAPSTPEASQEVACSQPPSPECIVPNTPPSSPYVPPTEPVYPRHFAKWVPDSFHAPHDLAYSSPELQSERVCNAFLNFLFPQGREHCPFRCSQCSRIYTAPRTSCTRFHRLEDLHCHRTLCTECWDTWMAGLKAEKRDPPREGFECLNGPYWDSL